MWPYKTADFFRVRVVHKYMVLSLRLVPVVHDMNSHNLDQHLPQHPPQRRNVLSLLQQLNINFTSYFYYAAPRVELTQLGVSA